MNVRDYQNLLDKIPDAGIYVIGAVHHEILYFNRRIQTAIPDIRLGKVCYELWPIPSGQSLEEFPEEYHTVLPGSPLGFAADLTASRILWGEDNIPAVSVTLIPHRKTDGDFWMQEIILSLGKQCPDIYTIDLEQGLVSVLCRKGEWKQADAPLAAWEQFTEQLFLPSLRPSDQTAFRDKFSLEALRQMQNSSSVKPALTCLRHEGNSERYILFSARPGPQNYAVLTVQDCDERVRQELAHASRKEFLTRMSHDIRIPMNGIIGMTNIAAAHLSEQERVSDCLSKILISGRHLLSLINEILDMNRIEAGRFSLQEEPFTLSVFLQDLVAVTRPTALEKGHELRVLPMEITHDCVLGDPAHIQQIFSNILGNAIKYTPPGGTLELEISEKPACESGFSCYQFIFTDNGIGIAPDYLKHIFEPFSRAEDSRVAKIHGSGLGLTIALNIARMMRGNITVESTLGRGSKFTVTLMLKHEPVPAVSSGAGTLPPGRFSLDRFEGCRILLAEDNSISREIAEEIISSTGAIVETANNGRQALEMFQSAQEGYYDLVIMDIEMPVMDGYQASRAIRKLQRRDASLTPIIAMSANAYSEDMAASRAAGMNEHITKPLEIDRLMASMNHWLHPGGKQPS